jgi:hypothetical protein
MKNWSTILFVLLFIGTFCIVDLMAQNPYTGPATGSITGGALVSTGSFEGTVLNQLELSNRIRNPYWQKYNPKLADDRFNRTPAAAPLGSNEFIDPSTLVTSKFLAATAPFDVIDFEGNTMTNSIPPDPIMAVGPNHIMTLVNTVFTIWDKQGNKLFSSLAATWFNNVVSNNDAFDPQVVYDHFEGRWIMLWDGGNLQTEGYYLVSVSDDDNPMGDWYNYAFPANRNGMTVTNVWADYPKLGYDQHAVYMSGRMFSFPPNQFFQYCQVRWVSKTELYNANGGPVSYTDIWDIRDPANLGQRVDGPPIAATHLDSTNTTYLIVDSPYFTSTFATLWKIQNPTGTPVISAVNVPVTATQTPLDGQQLGGGQAIDVGRRVYRNAVLKDGSLWSCMSVRGGTNLTSTFARYVRIDVNTNTAIEDVSFGADGFFLLYPAIMVDSLNNMVMVFTRTGYTEYAGFGYTGRKDIDPVGELAPTVILKEGEGNYVVTFSGTRNRWGDYMGIAQDPAQPGVVWAFVEYAKAPSNTWGTWVAGLTYLYAASGFVRNASNQNPVAHATLEVAETGNSLETDSTGIFSFASPVENVTISVSAFGYQDTSFTKSLTLYNPDTFDIELQPQIVSTISGQVLDPGGSGVESELEFYAQGDPNPGPYATVLTDQNGNYTLPTIIGTYDIHVYPASPHAFQIERFIVLNPSPLTYDIVVSPADIMLVDDDINNSYETYYTAAFDSLDKTYHRWDTQVDGLPTAAIRNAYPDKLIVWFTGDSSANPISPAEQDEILDHIMTGGKIFLTGQDIAETLNGTHLLDTLGIAFNQNTTTTLIRGVLGDEISNGLVMILNGVGSANNQTSSDVIAIEDTLTTTPIFYYGGGTGSPAAAKFTNDQFHSRAVFLGFGFESINDVSKRVILMERVIEYLELPFTGIGNNLTSVIPEKFELFQNFPNPFNPETTIEFAVPKLSRVKIVIYNSLGQEVRKLTDEVYNPGVYKAVWNGRDDFGLPVASGVYFYRMTTNRNNNFIKKLLLLK